MRVAHIVAHPPFREGTGTAAYYYVRAARQHGVDAHLYAPDLPGKPAADTLDIPVHYMPCHFSVGNAYLTPHLLAITPPDILHLHGPFIFGNELSLWLVARGGIPLLVTYHNDLLSDLKAGGIRYPVFAVYNRTVLPAVLRSARHLTVPSLDSAAQSIYGTTLFQQRAAVLTEVPNGVDVELFHPTHDGSSVRQAYNIAPDKVVVFYIASLDRSHHRKGLALLLEAIAALHHADVHLLVVGDGDMRHTYERRAAQPDLVGRVTFAGRQRPPAVVTYFAAADIVAIPSLPPETFGIALAEGMAMGKPAIGSNIPGVRRVVKDGETGFLITPGSLPELVARLRTLVCDPALRQQMGQQARARMEQEYSWRAVGAQLRRVYDEVLQRG